MNRMNRMNCLQPASCLTALDSLAAGDDLLRLSEGLEPEEALALAIVLQALLDWRRARSVLSRSPDHAGAAALLRETEAFLRSRWFRQLMDTDGDALLRSLRAMPAASASPRGLGAGPADPDAPRTPAPARAGAFPAGLRDLAARRAAFRRRTLRRRNAG